MDDIEPEWMKRIAILMAVNCVTKHVKGRISDDEMQALSKQVVNKIYTFLHYWLKHPLNDGGAFLEAMNKAFPADWDAPEFDAEFLAAIEAQRGGKA